MKYLQLRSDVLDGAGEADDGIAGFVISSTESHSAKCRDRDGGASHCCDNLNHEPVGIFT